ncbi:MAG: hypothetical protein ABW154_10705, partial [Dyella sp.]
MNQAHDFEQAMGCRHKTLGGRVKRQSLYANKNLLYSHVDDPTIPCLAAIHAGGNQIIHSISANPATIASTPGVT